MSETITLDPTAEATGRTQIDLTPFIRADGVDWGDSQIEQYLAQGQVGADPVDYRMPNRTISIPLLLTARGTVTFDTIRRQLQQKVGLFQREQGWLSRVTSAGTLFADVVNATLHMGGDWMQARSANPADVNATLSLECRPDFYGAEITLDSQASSAAELVGVLKQSAVNASIAGDYPARCRIVVTETASIPRFGLLAALRSRNYSSASTAALAYEAEALTPLDTASRVALANASGGTVVSHTALASAAWTPVLSTKMLAGTADLTHTGSYRVWTRAYSTAATPPRVRLVWDTGELNTAAENTPQYVPAASSFYDLDLGEIRLDAAPIGTHKWQGRIEGRGDAGGEDISIDKVWFVPVDEAYSLLRMTPSNLAGAISARDDFTSMGGTLNGRTPQVGAAWASSGAATDFSALAASAASAPLSLPPSDAVGRSASSASLRFAVLGPTMTNQQVSAQVGTPATGTQETGACGVIARWVDANNYLRFTVARDYVAPRRFLIFNVVKVVAGTPTTLATDFLVDNTSEYWGTLSLAVTNNGNVAAQYFSTTGALRLTLPASDAALATAGTLASGKGGIVDSGDGTNVVQRWYDDVVISDTGPEPVVLNNGRSSELRWDGHYRQTSDGTGYDQINYVIDDLPRLPPSGLEGRPVELFVKASRGDFDQRADSGIDAISAQVKYRPSYLFAS